MKNEEKKIDLRSISPEERLALIEKAYECFLKGISQLDTARTLNIHSQVLNRWFKGFRNDGEAFVAKVRDVSSLYIAQKESAEHPKNAKTCTPEELYKIVSYLYEQFKNNVPVIEALKKYNLSPKFVRNWYKKFEEKGEKSFIQLKVRAKNRYANYGRKLAPDKKLVLVKKIYNCFINNLPTIEAVIKVNLKRDVIEYWYKLFKEQGEGALQGLIEKVKKQKEIDAMDAIPVSDLKAASKTKKLQVYKSAKELFDAGKTAIEIARELQLTKACAEYLFRSLRNNVALGTKIKHREKLRRIKYINFSSLSTNEKKEVLAEIYKKFKAGVSQIEASHSLKVSIVTIRNWYKRFEKKGEDGLKNAYEQNDKIRTKVDFIPIKNLSGEEFKALIDKAYLDFQEGLSAGAAAEKNKIARFTMRNWFRNFRLNGEEAKQKLYERAESRSNQAEIKERSAETINLQRITLDEKRELFQKIIDYSAEGKSILAIAKMLNMSYLTVYNILKKGAKNVDELLSPPKPKRKRFEPIKCRDLHDFSKEERNNYHKLAYQFFKEGKTGADFSREYGITCSSVNKWFKVFKQISEADLIANNYAFPAGTFRVDKSLGGLYGVSYVERKKRILDAYRVFRRGYDAESISKMCNLKRGTAKRLYAYFQTLGDHPTEEIEKRYTPKNLPNPNKRPPRKKIFQATDEEIRAYLTLEVLEKSPRRQGIDSDMWSFDAIADYLVKAFSPRLRNRSEVQNVLEKCGYYLVTAMDVPKEERSGPLNDWFGIVYDEAKKDNSAINGCIFWLTEKQSTKNQNFYIINICGYHQHDNFVFVNRTPMNVNQVKSYIETISALKNSGVTLFVEPQKPIYNVPSLQEWVAEKCANHKLNWFLQPANIPHRK